MSAPQPGTQTAPPPLGRGSIRRLLIWKIPANISVYLIVGAVPVVLLPLHFESVDPAGKVGNLPIVAAVGACAVWFIRSVR